MFIYQFIVVSESQDIPVFYYTDTDDRNSELVVTCPQSVGLLD